MTLEWALNPEFGNAAVRGRIKIPDDHSFTMLKVVETKSYQVEKNYDTLALVLFIRLVTYNLYVYIVLYM